MQLSINSHAFIADTPEAAVDAYFPGYATSMSKLGKERGWPPFSKQQFEHSTGPQGALLAESPQQVIDKILYEYELFGHTRFLAQMDVGGVNHIDLMRSIEQMGTKVAPEVRKQLGKLQINFKLSPDAPFWNIWMVEVIKPSNQIYPQEF